MPPHRGKWLRLPLFLGALLLLSSCSFTDLAYNHLDLLARYFLTDYVDFTPEQRHEFDRRFDTVWTWHRATQMPKYAATAHAIAAQVMQVQTPEQVRATLEQIDGFGEPVAKRALQEGGPLIASLSDEQVTHLLTEIDQKIAKEQARVARRDDAEWHRHEFKESRDSFEKYAGDLTPAQETRIRQYTDAAMRDPDLYHRAALDARQRFAELLTQRHETDFTERLPALLEPHSPDADQIDKMQRESRTRFVQLLADLSLTYSPQQRQHFHDKVESLAQELDDLAKPPQVN